jgi:hypothetical protein
MFVLTDVVPAVSRDPHDDVYLTCARAGDADVLITGDQDLLVLQVHGRTRILTPAQFLGLLESFDAFSVVPFRGKRDENGCIVLIITATA